MRLTSIGPAPSRLERCGLREAGLLGIAAPESFGGPGVSLAEIASAVEKVAGACCSAGMVYAMHVCATAAIASSASPEQPGARADTLRAIASWGTTLTPAATAAGTSASWTMIATLMMRASRWS